MSGSHLCPAKNKTVISKTELKCFVFQLVHSYICERFINFQDRSAYSAAGKCVDQSWEYINRSQTHECGNWDWGRAIPEKEYKNRIFLAVWLSSPGAGKRVNKSGPCSCLVLPSGIKFVCWRSPNKIVSRQTYLRLKFGRNFLNRPWNRSNVLKDDFLQYFLCGTGSIPDSCTFILPVTAPDTKGAGVDHCLYIFSLR